jgi:hypothetical protein
MSIIWLVAIVLIVLILASGGGWGYGRYYAGPVGVGPAPYASPLGILAAVLVLLLILWLLGGPVWFHPVLPP